MSNETRNIVVTGIAGRLGRLVTQRLHREPGIHVIGLDRRPMRGKPKDVELYQLDMRTKAAAEVFRSRQIDTLIHMGVMHAPRKSDAEHYSWNVDGTAKLFEYCRRYGVKKVIVLSSANVYGPRPENAQFLTEEAPLMAAQSFPGMRDLVEMDHIASSFFWRSGDIETVILRPVHILGRVQNAPSNYLRLKKAPVLMGFDPMVQIIHERDVAEAIWRATFPNISGIFNIVGAGQLPVTEILRELSRQTIPVPHLLAKPSWRLAFRLGISSFPSEQFDFIRFVCMVDGTRAAEHLKYHPTFSLRETIHAVDEFDLV